ncbi:hypothetical protein M8332_07100 (plasmid) [Fructilactobacillus ixorae]|uniref:Uncharacterized protein n=1 Tax=Fructilactobacillus ixorae TaxID=1750535 RepID=A0ABY5C757_9LACO|nr:hypothetical protein [Fructilactobacillus ixorae]USS93983.1 hypothetical protein M8332_07100 [Fructilactobacillus ixorae]
MIAGILMILLGIALFESFRNGCSGCLSLIVFLVLVSLLISYAWVWIPLVIIVLFFYFLFRTNNKDD